MSELETQASATASQTDDRRKNPGYFIVQIETHDNRVSGIFTSKAKPPVFDIHEVTPAKEFGLLSDLQHYAKKVETQKSPDGAGTVVTLAIESDDFRAEEVQRLSSMTQSEPDGKRPLLDSFRYRGSSWQGNMQRASIRSTGTKGGVEEAGREVQNLIDISLD